MAVYSYYTVSGKAETFQRPRDISLLLLILSSAKMFFFFFKFALKRALYNYKNRNNKGVIGFVLG